MVVGRERADTTHFHSAATPSTSGDENPFRDRSTYHRCYGTVFNPFNRPENDDILPELSRTLKKIVDQERTADKMSEAEDDSKPAYDLQRDIKTRLTPEQLEAGDNASMANITEPAWQDIECKILKGNFPTNKFQFTIYSNECSGGWLRRISQSRRVLAS